MFINYINMNNCDKISNNKYFNCPARMDDGRTFTDYRPSCFLENELQFSNKIPNSYEYRQFLINNSVTIMNMNREYNDKLNGCKSQNVPVPNFKQNCDINTNSVNCKLTDNTGIGIYYNATIDNKDDDLTVRPYDPYTNQITNNGLINNKN
jgi:hypothetical protein